MIKQANALLFKKKKKKKKKTFLRLDHKIKELPIGEYKIEVNFDLLLKNLC